MLFAAVMAVAGNLVKPVSGTMQTIYTVARIKHTDQGETTSKPYFKMFHVDRARKVFSIESGTVNSGIYVIDWDIKTVKKEGDTERFEMTFPKSREKNVGKAVGNLLKKL